MGSRAKESVASTTSFSDTRIYTLGHSTRTLDELVAILQSFEISLLVDIRSIPRSRHNPQFNRDSLPAALAARNIGYVHLAELGGLRKTHEDSLNQGWHNASFRGYADYMLSRDFEAGLAKLRALSRKHTLALMCAEAVPWRCHRSLVADALTVRGAQVADISSLTRLSPHRMTKFAKIEGTRITYPSDESIGEPLPCQGPFHLEATVRVLQRRATNLVDVWERHRYLRVLPSEQGLSLLEVQNHGTLDAPDLRFRVLSGPASSASHAPFERSLRRLLGLDVDPKLLAELSEAVPALRPTARALRGMRAPRFSGLFETFANVVPFQQVSLDAGVAIVGRLIERFGQQLEHENRSFYAFPTAEAIAVARMDALRRCGLSAQKAKTLRALARSIEAGALSEEQLAGMRTEDALKTLVELPGIGPWSASLVLLRGLGRLDVFPPGDVGAARGLRTLMRLDSKASLEHLLEHMGYHQGYFYFCALGDNLLSKGLIHAA